MSKPILYVDVDDTIVAEIWTGSGFDLRPNVMTQLRALTKLFEFRWLTEWSEKRIFDLVNTLYGQGMARNMAYTDWLLDGNKIDAVLARGHNFYWMEDPISFHSVTKLDSLGMLNRYIEVDPTGPDGFANACRALFMQAGISDADLKKVDSNIGWF